MPPKRKARGGVRQSEVFFPLADLAVVVHHAVPPGICSNRSYPKPSRSSMSSIVSSSLPPTVDRRISTLFASIIFVF